MLYSPTAPTTDTNCSTGCPYCGCSNPSCQNSTSFSGNTVVVGVMTYGGLARFSLFRDEQEEARLFAVPDWIVELRRTPRRMKRGLPARAEGPRHCHSARRLMRAAFKRGPTAAHRLGKRRLCA